MGFLPNKAKARGDVLAEVVALRATLVFYESGPRLSDSLAAMAAALGDREAAVSREISKAFGEKLLYEDLSFRIPPNAIVGVVGANGAGKTTTLRAICNMCSTSGSVVLGEEDISRAGTADIVRKGVAHVPQGRGTFPELSVLDNLMIGAYTRKDKEVKEIKKKWKKKK